MMILLIRDDDDQRTNMLRRTTTSLATVGFAGDTFSPVLGSLTPSYSVSSSWSSPSPPSSASASASLFLSHYVACYKVAYTVHSALLNVIKARSDHHHNHHHPPHHDRHDHHPRMFGTHACWKEDEAVGGALRSGLLSLQTWLNV